MPHIEHAYTIDGRDIDARVTYVASRQTTYYELLEGNASNALLTNKPFDHFPSEQEVREFLTENPAYNQTITLKIDLKQHEGKPSGPHALLEALKLYEGKEIKTPLGVEWEITNITAV